MAYLLLVSAVWAFSFGLTKGHLSGLDPNVVAWLRLSIAFLVFLPFLRIKGIPATLRAKLIGIGALQFGVMYLAYHWSFQSLKAYEIALFTVLTPVHVTLIHDVLSRRFRPVLLLTAVGGITGALVLKYQPGMTFSSWQGFVLVQVSNLAFAAGQVFYKRLRPALKTSSDSQVFAFPYLGAVLVSLIPLLCNPASLTSVAALSGKEILVLLYLGVIASGLCFFWWDKGATLTASGPLAVLNNLKIPAAVLVSIVVFGERGDWVRLGISGAILGASAWAASVYEKIWSIPPRS